MSTDQIITLVLGSATVGAILKSIVDWWLARGDKRISREDAIAAANDELAAKLREEMRVDNLALRTALAAAEAAAEEQRKRTRTAENQISELFGQMTQVNRANLELRNENLELQKQNGEASYRLGEQAKVIADQALQISTITNDLAIAKDRIAVLEAVMRKANVPLPEPSRRRGDTGPLGPAPAPA
jgi:hypothetical protein